MLNLTRLLGIPLAGLLLHLPAMAATSTLGPFETVGGERVYVDVAFEDQKETILVTATVRIEGLGPQRKPSGVFLQPKAHATPQFGTLLLEDPANFETSTIWFSADDKGWSGNIKGPLPVISPGEIHKGYGMQLLTPAGALKFRRPSHNRLHPTILELDFVSAAEQVLSDCGARIRQRLLTANAEAPL